MVLERERGRAGPLIVSGVGERERKGWPLDSFWCWREREEGLAP